MRNNTYQIERQCDIKTSTSWQVKCLSHNIRCAFKRNIVCDRKIKTTSPFIEYFRVDSWMASTLTSGSWRTNTSSCLPFVTKCCKCLLVIRDMNLSDRPPKVSFWDRHDKQLKVFLVGGPNLRRDYHLNEGEEVTFRYFSLDYYSKVALYHSFSSCLKETCVSRSSKTTDIKTW